MRTLRKVAPTHFETLLRHAAHDVAIGNMNQASFVEFASALEKMNNFINKNTPSDSEEKDQQGTRVKA